MDDQELRQKFDDLEKKIEAVYRSAEKARKYILWTIIVSAILFFLPLIGLVFAVPSFVDTYSQLQAL